MGISHLLSKINIQNSQVIGDIGEIDMIRKSEQRQETLLENMLQVFQVNYME